MYFIIDLTDIIRDFSLILQSQTSTIFSLVHKMNHFYDRLDYLTSGIGPRDQELLSESVCKRRFDMLQSFLGKNAFEPDQTDICDNLSSYERSPYIVINHSKSSIQK